MPPKKKSNGKAKPRIVPAPKNGSSSRSGQSYNAPLRITGHELCTTIAITTSSYPGERIYHALAGPSQFGQRIARFADLYEKYRVNRLVYKLDIVGPMTDDVQVIQSFDTDPKDTAPTQDAYGLQQIRSWAHNSIVTHSKGGGRMSVVIRQPSSGFFTKGDGIDSDIRLAYAGQYFINCIAPPATAAYHISVSVDYDITLYEPQLTDSQNAVQASTSFTSSTANTDTLYGMSNLNAAAFAALNRVKGVEAIRDDVNGIYKLVLRPGEYIVDQRVVIPDDNTGKMRPLSSLVDEPGSVGSSYFSTVTYGQSSPFTGVDPGIGFESVGVTVPVGVIANLFSTIAGTGWTGSSSASTYQYLLSRIGDALQ